MINKIYDEIRKSDLKNDIENMIYSRENLCIESALYADGTDVIRTFKEILALTDKYPYMEHNSLPVFAWRCNGTDIVMWIYKEIFLKTARSFYNISIDELKEYTSGFKKRWLSHGYTIKEPYRMELELCLESGDMSGAKRIIQKYIKIPLDNGIGTGVCTCGYVSTEIKYYLLNNEKDKAEEIAEKVKHEFHFGGSSYAYNEMWCIRRIGLEYCIINGDYKKADELAYILEHSHCNEKEFMSFASFMCAYAYNRTGRGLRIYKKHWKEWEEEVNPRYKYYTFKNAACFFKILNEAKGTGMVKLKTGSPVQAVNDNNIYSTEMLYKYYYKEAEKLAKRFDKRNGTDSYIRRLKITFENIL